MVKASLTTSLCATRVSVALSSCIGARAIAGTLGVGMKRFTAIIILSMASCSAWAQIIPSLYDPRFTKSLVTRRFANDYFAQREICRRADAVVGDEVESAIQRYRKEFSDIFSAVESGSDLADFMEKIAVKIPSAIEMTDLQKAELIARCKRYVIALNENLDDSAKRRALDKHMDSTRKFLFHTDFFPPDFPLSDSDAQQSAPADRRDDAAPTER